MSHSIPRALAIAALAAALSPSVAAVAQEGRESPLSVLERMFGHNPDRPPAPAAPSAATDQVLRIERLEAQIRQLTGANEQLQYRNRQLEEQIARMEAAGAPRLGPTAQPGSLPQPARQGAQPGPVLAAPMPPAAIPNQGPPPAAAGPGRRSDAFDPSANPNAPGAPRTLGSVSSSEPPPVIMAEPPVGAPGGRGAGSPLDLSTMATGAPPAAVQPRPPATDGGLLPPPPSRNLNATGAVASVAPPTEVSKDYYDLGYGYIVRKDYALAEATFQAFLQKFPSDKRVADAQFWLGESQFQRQRYDVAAQAFLDLSTKHAAHPKAADAMLRLGQSLAALNQKEMACATLAEVKRKYPRASNTVKQGIEREQKRVQC